ncbi:right-handed parallel beta-helix repeat-containing protein [Lysobacter sp. TAB13]|uniref:right-handed parallel beta-helix repeat-containing protein n=1 Tax=Lysobacter sp. TAB13 TaxID=3233065 RepID=UPI003F982CDF
MLPFAGLALSGLFFSHSALAACDTVLAPDARYIEAPGSYCLNADRARQIVISADNVELDCRGRTVSLPADQVENHGVHVRRGNNVIIRNCRLEHWPVALQVEEFSNVQILNNTIVEPAGMAINVFGGDRPEGDGLRVIGNRTIYYDAVNSSDDAIAIWHSPRPVLTNNVVVGFQGRASIRLERSPDAQLTGNQLLDLHEGGATSILLNESPRAQLVHNTIMLRHGVNARAVQGAIDATCIENVFINTVYSGLESCAVRRYNVERINND